MLPQWHGDDRPISLYYSGQRLLPRKTRLCIDHVVDQFREQRIAERLCAT